MTGSGGVAVEETTKPWNAMERPMGARWQRKIAVASGERGRATAVLPAARRCGPEGATHRIFLGYVVGL